MPDLTLRQKLKLSGDKIKLYGVQLLGVGGTHLLIWWFLTDYYGLPGNEDRALVLAFTIGQNYAVIEMIAGALLCFEWWRKRLSGEKSATDTATAKSEASSILGTDIALFFLHYVVLFMLYWILSYLFALAIVGAIALTTILVLNRRSRKKKPATKQTRLKDDDGCGKPNQKGKNESPETPYTTLDKPALLAKLRKATKLHEKSLGYRYDNNYNFVPSYDSATIAIRRANWDKLRDEYVRRYGRDNVFDALIRERYDFLFGARGNTFAVLIAGSVISVFLFIAQIDSCSTIIPTFVSDTTPKFQDIKFDEFRWDNPYRCGEKQFKKLYIEDTNGNVKEIKIFGDLYIFFNLAEDEAVWTSGLKYQCGNDNYDKFYLHLHNRNEMDWEKLSKNNPHTDIGHYVIFY